MADPCPDCGGSLLGPKELSGATDFYTPVCHCVWDSLTPPTHEHQTDPEQNRATATQEGWKDA